MVVQPRSSLLAAPALIVSLSACAPSINSVVTQGTDAGADADIDRVCPKPAT